MDLQRMALACLAAGLPIVGCNALFGLDGIALDAGTGGASVGGNHAGGGSNQGGHGAAQGAGGSVDTAAWSVEIEVDSPALAAGYTLSLTFDHQALVTAGTARADGSGLRMMYDDGSGPPVEIDRVLDWGSSFNQNDTTIWWRAQKPVAAGRTKGAYFLYYGAEGARPPNDRHLIYPIFEDFESAPSATGSLTNIAGSQGSITVSDGQLHLNTDSSSIGATSDVAHFWYWPIDGDFEAQMVVTSVAPPSGASESRLGGLMVRASLSGDSAMHWVGSVGPPGIWGAISRKGPGDQARNTFVPNVAPPPLHCKLQRIGDGTLSFSSLDGKSWTLIGSEGFVPSLGSAQVFVGLAQGSESTNAGRATIDWFQLRTLAGSFVTTRMVGAASEVAWDPSR